MSGGSAVSAPTAVSVRAHPERSRIDEQVHLEVTGLAAHGRVVLTVRTIDGSRREWAATATFQADVRGRVDTSLHAPVAGDYIGVDPIGLLWSMQPLEGRRPAFFNRRSPRPLSYTATATVEETEVGSAEFSRLFTDPDRPGLPAPTESGITGTYFASADGGPAPGVLVLGGSDGGEHQHAAALLSEQGYAALSLAYFGVEDRPPHLNHIELEYFRTALGWLADQSGVDDSRLVVAGLSRGGELALQLGALYPEIAGVIAAAPSGVRQAGLAESYTDFTQPAWVHNGEPLAFVPGKYGPRSFFGFLAAWVLRRPMRQRAMFERLLHDQDTVDAATIEVERIAGPVLLLSGSDDQLWPSERYAELITRRLRAHPRSYADRYVCYSGAGHFVSFPYALPSLPPMTRLSPMGRLTIDFGGDVESNARAARAAWQEILDFLDDIRVAGPRRRSTTHRRQT